VSHNCPDDLDDPIQAQKHSLPQDTVSRQVQQLSSVVQEINRALSSLVWHLALLSDALQLVVRDLQYAAFSHGLDLCDESEPAVRDLLPQKRQSIAYVWSSKRLAAVAAEWNIVTPTIS